MAAGAEGNANVAAGAEGNVNVAAVVDDNTNVAAGAEDNANVAAVVDDNTNVAAGAEEAGREATAATAPLGIVKARVNQINELTASGKILKKLTGIRDDIIDRPWYKSATHADEEKHNAYKTELVKQINAEVVRYNELYKDEPQLNILVYKIDNTSLKLIKAGLNIIISKIAADKIAADKKGGKLTRKIHKIKSNTVKSTTRKGGRKTNKSKKVSKNRRKTRRKL